MRHQGAPQRTRGAHLVSRGTPDLEGVFVAPPFRNTFWSKSNGSDLSRF